MSAFITGFLISIVAVACLSAMFFVLVKINVGPPTFMHVLGMVAGFAVGIAFILLPALSWIAKQVPS